MKVLVCLNPRKSPGYLSVFVAHRTISDLLFIFCALLPISQSRWKPCFFTTPAVTLFITDPAISRLNVKWYFEADNFGELFRGRYCAYFNCQCISKVSRTVWKGFFPRVTHILHMTKYRARRNLN